MLITRYTWVTPWMYALFYVYYFIFLYSKELRLKQCISVLESSNEASIEWSNLILFNQTCSKDNKISALVKRLTLLLWRRTRRNQGTSLLMDYMGGFEEIIFKITVAYIWFILSLCIDTNLYEQRGRYLEANTQLLKYMYMFNDSWQISCLDQKPELWESDTSSQISPSLMKFPLK